MFEKKKAGSNPVRNNAKIKIKFLSLIFFLFSFFNSLSVVLAKEDKEDKKAEFTLLDYIDSLSKELTVWHGVLIGAVVIGVVLAFIILIWRYGEFPIVLVQKGSKYGSKKLGRFIDIERSKDLPEYWILKFKSAEHGVREYYCTENFEEIKQQNFNRWYIVYFEFPHYISMKLKLDESDQFPELVRKKGKFNTFKYIIYRICCVIIWNKYIIRKIYDSIEFEKSDNMVKKVRLLQLEYLLEEITHVCDISYKKEIVDKKLGKRFQDYHEIDVPLYKVEDLKKDSKVDQESIKTSNDRIITSKIYDFKDAVNKRKSVNEIRSIMDLKLRRSNKELLELTTDYNTVREVLRKSKKESMLELQNTIEQIQKESDLTPDNLASFTAKILSLTNAGAKVENAVRIAIETYLSNQDNREFGKILTENETLKKSNDLLKEQNERLWNQLPANFQNKLKIQLEDNLEDK